MIMLILEYMMIWTYFNANGLRYMKDLNCKDVWSVLYLKFILSEEKKMKIDTCE